MDRGDCSQRQGYIYAEIHYIEQRIGSRKRNVSKKRKSCQDTGIKRDVAMKRWNSADGALTASGASYPSAENDVQHVLDVNW